MSGPPWTATSDLGAKRRLSSGFLIGEANLARLNGLQGRPGDVALESVAARARPSDVWERCRVPRKTVTDQLHKALTGRRLVQVHRRIRGAVLPAGYVVSIGRKWVVLHRVDDDGVYLDGHTAVRLGDISRVTREQSGSFVEAALKLQEDWPPVRLWADEDLSTTRGVLKSAAVESPLVTVHVERLYPDSCFIGVLEAVERRRLTLELVSPRATWLTGPDRYRLRDITRIDVGSRYERALWAVAGPSYQGARPPSAPPPRGPQS